MVIIICAMMVILLIVALVVWILSSLRSSSGVTDRGDWVVVTSSPDPPTMMMSRRCNRQLMQPSDVSVSSPSSFVCSFKHLGWRGEIPEGWIHDSARSDKGWRRAGGASSLPSTITAASLIRTPIDWSTCFIPIPPSVFSNRSSSTSQWYFGFGINYSGQNQLLTCWNDLKLHVLWWVSTIAHDPTATIVLFTDAPSSWLQSWIPQLAIVPTIVTPTVSNWTTWTETFIQHQQSTLDTELTWYYSGHGYRMRARHPLQELDGMMECLCLVDGFCWDEDLVSMFLSRLNPQCRVIAFFDSCHSGSVLNTTVAFNLLNGTVDVQSQTLVQCRVWCFSASIDEFPAASGATSSDLSLWTRSLYAMPTSIILPHCTEGSNRTKTPVDILLECIATLASNQESQRPELSASHPDLLRLPLFSE
jgi:Caspase domain